MKLKNILNDLMLASEKAAIAASKWIGKHDERSADRAAVESMRQSFNAIEFRAKIVIGEGERDEAPMLHIGEIVGNNEKSEVQFDIAVDPLECTTRCAHGVGGSMSAMLISEAGTLLPSPDVYMQKIAAFYDVVDLDNSMEENLQALSKAKGCRISDLTVAILDRERHKDIIKEVLKTGARINLMSDGDIAAAVMSCLPDNVIDMYIGMGGAPEGVIAAAAISMLKGHMQGRLVFKNESQRARAKSMWNGDIDKKYTAEDMINIQNSNTEAVFIATGVTSGDLLEGVKCYNSKITTDTICIYKDLQDNVFNRKIHTTVDEKKYFNM